MNTPHRSVSPKIPPAPLHTSVVLLLTMLAMTTITIPSDTRAAGPITPPHALSSGELQGRIARLGVVGRVLYIAAHPDDENTRLLAWLVGARGVRTAYLSITRGDGGQNLVGKERGDLLGVMRTHELLAARSIDGAEQRFTRAIDFGYSKTPAETLKIWDKQAILRDTVAVIRRFKPDVIIARFATTGRNHGHHTASAILAGEAFKAAADSAMFPAQVKRWGTWQATRLYENKSHWRMAKDADVSMYMQQDVGGYDPLRGVSFGEIAAWSRTSHKSQGFGSSPQRGPTRELFASVAGQPPAAGVKSTDPIFADIDITWARFPATSALTVAIKATTDGFDPQHPEASLPALASVRRALMALPDSVRDKAYKLAEVESLMIAAAGLHIDALCDTAATVRGDKLAARVELLAQRPVDATLNTIRWSTGEAEKPAEKLVFHHIHTHAAKLKIAKDAELSTPYWLRTPRKEGAGLHWVGDADRIGDADDSPPISAAIELTLAGERLTVRRPLLHRWRDRVRGELTRRVEILPHVTATADAEVLMLAGGDAQLAVTVRAHADKQDATTRIIAPKGWHITPKTHRTKLGSAGDEAVIRFVVKPPSARAKTAYLRIETTAGGHRSDLAEYAINHTHIPQRTVLLPAIVKAVPVELATGGKRIGYIAGAGDEVADRLRQVGYAVDEIAVDDLAKADLSGYDAIITGVRAFNVHPRLLQLRQRLFDYVAAGGTMLVQYNTNNRWKKLAHSVGPANFEIDRGRVTDETAELKPLNAKHTVLTTPNLLTGADYDGWVQERGLYFAKTWDKAFTPIFATADPGEQQEKGALLVMRHGKGGFVYSGMSFFRQLPAGVAGAYRLLANLLAWRGK